MIGTQNWIKLILGLLLGWGFGLSVPAAVRRIAVYKNEQRGQDTPADIMSDRSRKLLAVGADILLTTLVCILLAPAEAILAVCMVQVSIVCIFVDGYMHIIPNEAILVLLVLAVAYRVIAEGFASLLGSLAALGLVLAIFGGCAVYMKLRKGNTGVGAGDLKYAMVLALAFGWDNIFWFLGGTAAALIVYCGIGLYTRRLTAQTSFPMCPHLSVGLYTALLLPPLFPAFSLL